MAPLRVIRTARGNSPFTFLPFPLQEKRDVVPANAGTHNHQTLLRWMPTC
jgi:hypothetical protein